MTATAEQEAMTAAADIIAAFAGHERDRYFSLFEPTATFLFHSADRLLGSRAQYEAEWDSWEAEDGFRVLDCISSMQRADEVADGLVIFTHQLVTRVHDNDGDHEQHERETIVLRRQPDGRWLGIHEHLSPAPAV